METVRLRLAFDHILNESLKTKGLDRCWILLKPQHQTISDLSAYILHAFNLPSDCPSGLLLSMEEFALPPFESTSILKDKDIIRVEKIGGVSSNVLMIGNEGNYLEAGEIVETQPVVPAMNLLANEEFEKESGGYLSEEEEDSEEQEEGELHVESVPEEISVSKKRKASIVLKSSKKKQSKLASSEGCANVVDIANTANGEQNKTLKTSKDKEKRLSQTQENSNGNVDGSHSPKAKKLPSRSARRKKAKKRILKELRRQEKQLHGNSGQQSSEEDQPSDQLVCQESADKKNQVVVEQLPEKDTAEVQEDQNRPDEDSDVEEDVVPMVIRPGHIRFVPLGEEIAEQTDQQNQIPLDNFRWNGVTSKKKGQKWGREKTTPYKKNNYKNVNQDRPKALNGFRHQLNFDNLEFYTTLPQVGDVVAYRLIELSPSWTPEPSSYRVGKISRFDTKSNRVKLVRVPGYPIFPKEMENYDSALRPEPSPYFDDGSLWIEFASLIEVRLVRHGKSNSAKPVTDGADEPWIIDEGTKTDSKITNGDHTHTSSQENGTVNPWEEISRALSVKKEQLSQDNWNKGESSSSRRPWSYRSAMGPTMAFLRAQNEI